MSFILGDTMGSVAASKLKVTRIDPELRMLSDDSQVLLLSIDSIDCIVKYSRN